MTAQEKRRILICEDEPLIAEHLKVTLRKLGYEVAGTGKTEYEIYHLLKSTNFDLILLDINISGHFEGIKIGAFIRDFIQKPFIYVTAHSDRDTFSRALHTRPSSYIVKPFKSVDIYTGIELALHTADSSVVAGERTKETILVNVRGNHVKIQVPDVIYLKAEGNYTCLYLLTGRYMLRGNLTETLQNHLDERFVRVHKSFAVNTAKINSVGHNTVNVMGEQVPLGRSFRSTLLEKLS